MCVRWSRQRPALSESIAPSPLVPSQAAGQGIRCLRPAGAKLHLDRHRPGRREQTRFPERRKIVERSRHRVCRCGARFAQAQSAAGVDAGRRRCVQAGQARGSPGLVTGGSPSSSASFVQWSGRALRCRTSGIERTAFGSPTQVNRRRDPRSRLRAGSPVLRTPDRSGSAAARAVADRYRPFVLHRSALAFVLMRSRLKVATSETAAPSQYAGR